MLVLVPRNSTLRRAEISSLPFIPRLEYPIHHEVPRALHALPFIPQFEKTKTHCRARETAARLTYSLYAQGDRQHPLSLYWNLIARSGTERRSNCHMPLVYVQMTLMKA